MKHLRGQGATEYLVLLAVVLIVAMVAIVLLGFFPGLAVDAKLSQSDSYWRGAVRPFAILQHAQSSQSASLNMIVQNKEAEQRQLVNITINGSGISGNYTPTGSDGWYSAGESRQVTITGLTSNCTQGHNYEYTVTISFTDGKGIISSTEFGEKALVGKCS